jgi:hypothetical protein
MNYRIIFRDTLRLFRESKLLWILGGIAFISEVIFRSSIYSIRNPPVPGIAYPLFCFSLYFSFVAKGSLIFTTHQIMSEQTPTYSEAWEFSKSKPGRILWLYFLSIPLVMFAVFLIGIVLFSEISTSLTWFMDVLVTLLLSAVFTLSICTIVIHNLEAGLALWTGLSIIVKNFFDVVILNSIFLVLELAVNIAVGNSLLGMFFVVPLTVTMTLAYRGFIAKGSYPALSNIPPTA